MIRYLSYFLPRYKICELDVDEKDREYQDIDKEYILSSTEYFPYGNVWKVHINPKYEYSSLYQKDPINIEEVYIDGNSETSKQIYVYAGFDNAIRFESDKLHITLNESNEICRYNDRRFYIESPRDYVMIQLTDDLGYPIKLNGFKFRAKLKSKLDVTPYVITELDGKVIVKAKKRIDADNKIRNNKGLLTGVIAGSLLTLCGTFIIRIILNKRK